MLYRMRNSGVINKVRKVEAAAACIYNLLFKRKSFRSIIFIEVRLYRINFV
jgi:hypothetical protein